MTTPTKHGAQWSAPVVDAILDAVNLLDGIGGPFLDPFGGVNGLSFLADRFPRQLFAGELEPEWASQIPHPAVVHRAQALPFRSGGVGCYCTSITCANRMGETYTGSDTGEKCRTCMGDPDLQPSCKRCNGTAKARSTRNNYTVWLGRTPTDGSTAAITWQGTGGKEWRAIHSVVFREAYRVLVDGGYLLLNVKDHRKTHNVKRDGRVHAKLVAAGEPGNLANRRGEAQYEVRKYVTDWCLRELLNTGFRFHSAHHVHAAHLAYGANHDARVEGEELLVLRKPTPSELQWP